MRAAARAFEIPYGTLRDRLAGRTTQAQAQTAQQMLSNDSTSTMDYTTYSYWSISQKPNKRKTGRLSEDKRTRFYILTTSLLVTTTLLRVIYPAATINDC